MFLEVLANRVAHTNGGIWRFIEQTRDNAATLSQTEVFGGGCDE